MTQQLQLQADRLGIQRQARWLFRSVSFTVKTGEALFVQGFNGVGKSTLLRLLAGLMPPSEGVVTYGKCAEPHPTIAYLGHQSGLLLDLTPLEYLRYIARLYRVCRPSLDAFFVSELGEAGLEYCQMEPCFRLSAGQRKRLGIIRCSIIDQAIWLLDEPFSSLDTTGQAWLMKKMDAHSQSGGILVYTDHHALYRPSHTLVLDRHAQSDVR